MAAAADTSPGGRAGPGSCASGPTRDVAAGEWASRVTRCAADALLSARSAASAGTSDDGRADGAGADADVAVVAFGSGGSAPAVSGAAVRTDGSVTSST